MQKCSVGKELKTVGFQILEYNVFAFIFARQNHKRRIMPSLEDAIYLSEINSSRSSYKCLVWKM